MGFLDKMIDVLGFVEKNEDYDDYEEEKAVAPVPKQETRSTVASRTNNIVTLNHPKDPVYVSNQSGGGENARVVLVEPTRFEESQNIADSLLNKKAVVINIESCETEIAAKLIDFIGGVVYAIDGSIQKVSQGIVLAAPSNIDIASELKRDLENDNEEIFAWVSRYNRRGDF